MIRKQQQLRDKTLNRGRIRGVTAAAASKVTRTQ
jgi:hypothetical protein